MNIKWYREYMNSIIDETANSIKEYYLQSVRDN